MRVKLRVDRATWEDIRRRIMAAGQPDRLWSDNSIDMHEICIEPEPRPAARTPEELQDRMPN